MVTIANVELFKPEFEMFDCILAGRVSVSVCVCMKNGICLNFNFGLEQLQDIFECAGLRICVPFVNDMKNAIE